MCGDVIGVGVTGEHRRYAGISQGICYLLPIRNPERIHVKGSLIFQLSVVMRQKTVM